ncbi:nucleotide exchange factor GrpE [Candidatus Saccharibacteria bacterium]|nr:nucleotide exchange factor GrpE [Candidatus Saccharibacteria bacterium]
MKKDKSQAQAQPAKPQAEPAEPQAQSEQAQAQSVTPQGQPQADLQQKLAELTSDLQRTRADFENYRKQMDLQKSQAASFAKYETIKKVLPLLDDMSRAIASTPELKPLEKTLEKTLKELNLATIDTKPGTLFNPDIHDAVMMEDGDGDTEVISETLRPGYLYEGEVIRPAMVKVTTK